MLKRVMNGLLVVLVGVSFFVSLYSADIDENRRMREAANSIGISFTIPAQSILDDPDIVLPVLVSSATKHHINVFRTSVGYDANDMSFTSHYILLTSDYTCFYDTFRLRGGRFMSSGETQDSDFFVSSNTIDSSLQIGQLEDICRNDSISIRGLHEAYKSLPVAGRYFIEYRLQEDADAFLEDFIEGLNTAGANITRESLKSGSSVNVWFISENSRYIYWSLIWAVIIAVLILVAYRQLYESKRTAVLLLQGNSAFQAWFIVTGQKIISSMAVLSVISILASVVVPGTTTEFIFSNALTIIAVSLLTMTASLITVLYIANMKTYEALKNRKDTGTLVIYNTVIKCVLSLILIFSAISGLSLLKDIKEASNKLGSWQSTSRYGIFYPRSIGNDMEEVPSGQIVSISAEIYGLYPALNELGALFVYAAMYEPLALERGLPEGVYRSMQVNPNYLLEYPVADTDGEAIHISEEETDWILLIPMRYKSEEELILSYFNIQRFGNAERESQADFEKRVFGQDVSDVVRNQSIRIIWVRDDQRVFTFNPAVEPEDGNCVIDPIIEVMTVSNSMAFDRINGITSTSGTGIKVKLINGDTSATLDELRGLLQGLHLDDNLLHLVTLNDYALLELQEIQQGFRNVLAEFMLVFVLFLILSVQSVTLQFEQNARRITVCKLVGYSFLSRHKSFFLMLLTVWIGLFTASLTLPHLPIPLPVASISTTLSVVSGVFLLEAAVSATVLVFVESRRIPNVIKGEF